MNAYLAFTKKEALECIRTYKFMILLIVFFVLGFMNPITAKYTPVLIKSMMPEIDMNLSEPTVLDSWMQFFKNVSQMGIVIFLLMFSGILSHEFTKGTLINMVSKGLKRRTILLSKTSFLIIMWTLCYGSAAMITLCYGLLFWSQWNLPNLFFSVFCVWLFGVLLCTLLLLGSVITRSSAGGLLMAGGVFLVLMLISMIPDFTWNPILLTTNNMALIQESVSVGSMIPSILVCISLITVSIAFSIQLIKKKQL